MKALTSELLGRACRLYLAAAYPGGEVTIPETRRVFLHIPADADLADFVPPASCTNGIAQTLKAADGSVRGYSYRLGSAHFPHLKLQVTDHNGNSVCVFAVDTHDAFPFSSMLPPDHPDQAAWTTLRLQNQRIKEEIEKKWDQADLWTFNRLLREELKKEV